MGEDAGVTVVERELLALFVYSDSPIWKEYIEVEAVKKKDCS